MHSVNKKRDKLRKDIQLGLSTKRKILAEMVLLNDQLDFCNEHISKSQKDLDSYENKERSQQHLKIPLALLVIIFLAVGFFVFKPALTGYTTITVENNYTQDLGLVIDSNSEHAWFLENPGDLRSLKISGSISKDGYAQVYVLHKGVKYVVFDSDTLVGEWIAGITGLAVSNETSEITNETNQTNKTIPINETINETKPLENISIINETIPINETNITKNIIINLDYASGTAYDPDDDGVEASDGIIDFTVENTDFSWNVDFSKVCTKWETYSADNEEITTVCYGAEACCNFIGLMPTSLEWDEDFLSAYSQHGASVNNVISSQVLYVDYNASLENPYSDIHNSEWGSLNATFSDDRISFNDVCVDTCLLSGFNETFYTLIFNVSNATLAIDSVDYSVLEELEVVSLAKVSNATVSEEEVIQYSAVIGKPVKWKKIVKLANKTSNLTVILPKEATNVSVNKFVYKRVKEKVKEAKIKTKNRVNYVDTYNLITASAVVDTVASQDTTELIIEEEVDEVEIEYETPAPEAVEEEISSSRKQVVISSSVHYTNILAYTSLPTEAREGQIKLYWLKDSGREVASFDAYDTNGNSLIDYIEWVVPSLSSQTYELIIEISAAEHLDSDRNFVSDIYEHVKAQDDYWSEPIPAGHYVRATFKEALDSSKDITIYARSDSGSSIAVYTEQGNELIATFNNISAESYYKVYLTALNDSYSTFDLEIVGDSVEFDYIVDPTVIQVIDSNTTGYTGLYFGKDWRESPPDYSVTINESLTSGWFSVAKPLDIGTNRKILNVSLNSSRDFNVNDSILGLWRFEEGSGSTVYDESTYSNDGTITGATFTSDAHNGEYGMNFKGGSGNSITVTSPVFNGDAISISQWVYPTLSGSSNSMLGLYSSDTPRIIWGYDNSDQVGIWDTDAGWLYAGAAGAFDKEQWYHLVFIWNGTGRQIWVDGVLEGSGGGNLSSNDITGNLWIGAEGGSSSFNGTIDSTMIFNYSLSATEISEMFNATNGTHPDYDSFANATVTKIRVSEGNATDSYSPIYNGSNVNLENLTGFWSMDNGTAYFNGTHVLDSSGYENHGEILGATCQNTTGFIDAGCDFDGVNDWILVSDSNNLIVGSSNYTHCAWANANGLDGTERNIVETDGSTGLNEQIIRCSSVGCAYFNRNGANIGFRITPVTDEWHHYCGVRNGDDYYTYYDGLQTNSENNAGGDIPGAVIDVGIGRRPNTVGSYWNGSIDQVMVFNQSLTTTEVKELYETSALKYTDWIQASTNPEARFVQYNVSLTSKDKLFSEYVLNVTMDYNEPPTISAPKLNSTTHPKNMTYANLTCINTTQSDEDDDALFNSYNWFINNISMTQLHMSFDTKHNSTNWTYDFSGEDNHGWINGSSWNKTGGINGSGAYDFDGSNDYIDCGTSNLPTGNSSRTIMFWMKPRAMGGYDTWFSYGTTNTYKMFSITGGPAGTFQTLGIERWGATAFQWKSNVTLDVWTHVAITLDNGKDVVMYLNGTKDKNVTYDAFNTAISATVSCVIGSRIDDHGGDADGLIDEVRVFNRSLSASQIYAIYSDQKDQFTLVSDETSAEDVVKCQITTSDGTDYSQANSSEIVALDGQLEVLTALQ